MGGSGARLKAVEGDEKGSWGRFRLQTWNLMQTRGWMTTTTPGQRNTRRDAVVEGKGGKGAHTKKISALGSLFVIVCLLKMMLEAPRSWSHYSICLFRTNNTFFGKCLTNGHCDLLWPRDVTDLTVNACPSPINYEWVWTVYCVCIQWWLKQCHLWDAVGELL